MPLLRSGIDLGIWAINMLLLQSKTLDSVMSTLVQSYSDT